MSYPETDPFDAAIYVDSPQSAGDIMASLSSIFDDAIRTESDFSTPLLQCSIGRNDEYNPSRNQDPGEGFLFYRYKIDVCSLPGTEIDTFTRQVGALFLHLRQTGCRCVVASDFDGRLPKSGGYAEGRYIE